MHSVHVMWWNSPCIFAESVHLTPTLRLMWFFERISFRFFLQTNSIVGLISLEGMDFSLQICSQQTNPKLSLRAKNRSNDHFPCPFFLFCKHQSFLLGYNFLFLIEFLRWLILCFFIFLCVLFQAKSKTQKHQKKHQPSCSKKKMKSIWGQRQI